MVDTVAEHVSGRVVNAVFHFGFELGTHLLVISAGVHEALEYDREIGLGLALAILLHESTDEIIGLMVSYEIVSGGDGALKHRVGVAALHGAEHVRHIHLQDYVHTAFEVEAKADAPFAHFVEGVAQVHFLLGERVHIVFVSLVVSSVIIVAGDSESVLSSCVLVLGSNERERQIEKTH